MKNSWVVWQGPGFMHCKATNSAEIWARCSWESSKKWDTVALSLSREYKFTSILKVFSSFILGREL